ncbi:molybdopterin-dependent oxidoreductase [Nocardioides sp. C4-1]|uniref:molybdopterin-dependent oxidoreductase n=1 Tax=Nocardioides sp. C4-1 TaxID=3151851 RepID=UPI00326709DA
MVSRWLYAVFGLVSALVGLAVGHLVAAFTQPDSSPLLAVGSYVVDLGTDGSMAGIKDWAIEQFGDNDKVFLVGSVMAGVAVLALVAGLVTRLGFRWGALMMLLLVAVAGAAVVVRPLFEVLDLVPTVLAAVFAVASLYLLDRLGRGLPVDPRARSSAEVAKAEGAQAAVVDPLAKPRAVLTDAPVPDEADVVISPGGEAEPAGASSQPSRRGVLIATGVLTAAAAVMGGAGRLIGQLRLRPENFDLPTVAAAEIPKPLPMDLSKTYSGITPLQISRNDFYRVDTRLDVPLVDSNSWSLEVTGDVENEFTLSFDDVLDMPQVERDITLTCVSNSVGGKYVGGARWQGVLLKDIIDRAKPGSGVDQMMAHDFDGMTIGTPYDLLTDGREALLAIGMNGEPLPREHGFPARIIIPGLYGFISATKWVTKLDFTTYAAEESYWTERKWDTRAPIKPSARIDTPRGATPIPGDQVIIGGVAWAQDNGGVAKVQVRIDGGPWVDATTGPDVNNVYWRQWYYDATGLESGQHNVSARMVDGDGQTQTDARANPFPGGSSGLHTLLFNVE